MRAAFVKFELRFSVKLQSFSGEVFNPVFVSILNGYVRLFYAQGDAERVGCDLKPLFSKTVHHVECGTTGLL